MCSTVQEQITTCGQNAIVKIGERTNIRPQKASPFECKRRQILSFFIHFIFTECVKEPHKYTWSYVYWSFLETMFLKTSVSNGIIYTKYTQNPHIIEPPFNIATQSATYTVTACVSRWEPNGLNANNPCPAARQNNIGILLVCCGFQLWNVNPTVRKTLLCLKTWLLKAYIWLKQNYKFICTSNGEGLNGVP